MSKHTPGPWSINGNAIETDDMAIAHIYDPDENGPDEYAANARLIAAAPELLGAAAGARALIRTIDAANPGGFAVGAVLLALDKAIARATEATE